MCDIPKIKTRRVFISHRWNRLKEEYYSIREKLNSLKYFKYRDYSVPPNKRLEANTELGLKRKLTRKLKQVSSVIVPASFSIYHSEWKKYELERAKKLGKPIIALKRKGQKRIPRIIKKYADAIVTRKDKLKKVIRRLY